MEVFKILYSNTEYMGVVLWSDVWPRPLSRSPRFRRTIMAADLVVGSRLRGQYWTRSSVRMRAAYILPPPYPKKRQNVAFDYGTFRTTVNWRCGIPHTIFDRGRISIQMAHSRNHHKYHLIIHEGTIVIRPSTRCSRRGGRGSTVSYVRGYTVSNGKPTKTLAVPGVTMYVLDFTAESCSK